MQRSSEQHSKSEKEANFEALLKKNIDTYLNHHAYSEDHHIKHLCDLIRSRNIENEDPEVKALFTELTDIIARYDLYSLKFILLANLRQLLDKSNELPREGFDRQYTEPKMLIWGYERKLKSEESVSLFWRNLECLTYQGWNTFCETIKISGITTLDVSGNGLPDGGHEQLLNIIRQNNIRKCLMMETGSLKRHLFYSMLLHPKIGEAIGSADPTTFPPQLQDDCRDQFPRPPGLIGTCGDIYF